MINFTEYFREERDVWVRCTVPGQVSISFENTNGRSHGVTVPYGKDPVNLSASATFNEIKTSASVRGLFSANAIQLMTADEVMEYFEEKAEKRGLTGGAEEAQQLAAERRNKMYSRQRIGEELSRPPASAAVFDEPAGTKFDGVIRIEDTVTPRVMHLCRQVATDINENDRMPAADLLDELDALEGILTEDDFEYIRANGTYHSVKKWASKRASALVEATA